MLDMGFLPALRRIVAVVPRRRQTLLFSATMSEAIIRVSAEFTQSAARVDVGLLVSSRKPIGRGFRPEEQLQQRAEGPVFPGSSAQWRSCAERANV
jgi:superfamily II DNA/RNA helicase